MRRRAALLASALLLCAWRAIDGDTVEHRGERIRLAGIDAPELHGRCPAERAAARQAQHDVARRLASARSIAVQRLGRDRHGRTVARIALDGHDLGTALVLAGLVRPWSGRGQRPSWCR